MRVLGTNYGYGSTGCMCMCDMECEGIGYGIMGFSSVGEQVWQYHSIGIC